MISLFRNRQLLALAIGHFGVDMYPNILPVMYPLLVGTLGLNYTMVGVAQLVFMVVSSLAQPGFGYLADRHGARYYAAGGVLFSALAVGLLGFIWDYASLLIVLGLMALGNAAFHPQGAMNSAAVANKERRASAMSIYMLGGNVGYSFGPVLGAALFATSFGVRATALLTIPGILIALLLSRLMVKVDLVKRSSGQVLPKGPRSHEAIPYFALGAIVAIVMIRSWSLTSLISFLPFWYQERGLPLTDASGLMMVTLLSFSTGGMIGGYLSDRFGRSRIVAISLIFASLSLYTILSAPGQWTILAGMFVGVTFGMSSSVTLVMAQELLPRSMGMASGLILGLGFVTGGLGVAVTGWLADQSNLAAALNSLIFLPIIGSALCFAFPLLLRFRSSATEQQLVEG